MKYYSTNRNSPSVTFEEALMNGLAPDGGLYMPESIPKLEKSFLENLENLSFQEIAFEIAKRFIEGEIEADDLKRIINEAINFPAPVIRLDEKLSVLELFHGPTLAFKDFGARFMAKSMAHFISKENRRLNILVATSGDTGSAVANGFYDTPGINVFILYPKGKVSYIQEKQLTTLNKNITALEIDGTFDDCQRLVKSAFVDTELNNKMNLSSANSINFARLLPQTFYYFEAFKQLKNKTVEIYFCVPSGNLGNLSAGLIAKEMGLPITKFIAATNSNRTFTEFVKSGKFVPRDSILTLSNAMDVGNPSNLARISSLYSDNLNQIREIIFSDSGTDNDTINAIKSVYSKHNYILDPHGAVGYFVLNNFLKKLSTNNHSAILLETAHPSKFLDIVEKALNVEIEIPERLQSSLSKEKKSVPLSKHYNDLKDYFWSIEK
ncbi:MAG: threonine synthase [Ignavibacteria bacterium]|nr:threonine synthase [Ignavibacteria bacterium]